MVSRTRHGLRRRTRLRQAMMALTALVVVIATSLATPAPPAFAAEGRVTGFEMPVQPLPFRESTIAFPERELAFPSSLVRTEKSDSVEVNLPADVLFDFDKAELRADARDTLRELGTLLLEKPRRSIAITGHTDAIGTDTYNQRLSERRAASVKTWLVSKEGIKSPPITTAGRGARDPVAPNRKPDGSDDPEGRQLNRRVTVVYRN